MTTRRDRESYRQTIKLSKANQEAEIRSVTRKMSHRPVAEIVQIIRERTGISPDPAFIATILAEQPRG